MKRGAAAIVVVLSIAAGAGFAWAQTGQGPTDPKAQKSYAKGMEWVKSRDYPAAISSFKKADKQDGDRCVACLQQILTLSVQMGDYKSADEAAQQIIAQTPATDARALALAHEQRGTILLREGMLKNKGDFYAEADKECKAALAAYPNFPHACFVDGLALGHMKQDDAARVQFERYVAMNKENSADRGRAERFIEHPELVRARMAPAFAITTLDGQRVSLDGLQGKVVLIDFWATWCGPCREALPHIREIARKFQGQPLVVLSVSLDTDEAKWKDFVAKNDMTWLQYRDGGFGGSLATLFGVHVIPHTFTIDPDGILQDEHVGDGSIEGKLKKLCARARELEEAPRSAAAAGQ